MSDKFLPQDVGNFPLVEVPEWISPKDWRLRLEKFSDFLDSNFQAYRIEPAFSGEERLRADAEAEAELRKHAKHGARAIKAWRKKNPY